MEDIRKQQPLIPQRLATSLAVECSETFDSTRQIATYKNKPIQIGRVGRNLGRSKRTKKKCFSADDSIDFFKGKKKSDSELKLRENRKRRQEKSFNFIPLCDGKSLKRKTVVYSEWSGTSNSHVFEVKQRM